MKGEKYTNIIDSNKIAFYGASHGGLIGAVTMNIKRNLFRAVVLLNGNMDLITDLPHKGRIWAKKYGNLNNVDDFECIKKYAPLLHIERPTNMEETYPLTLIVASKNDEIVSIANSLKYLAHRREKAKNNKFQKSKPTLLKVLNSGSHDYRTAVITEYIGTIFVKLQFLAEAMELKVDEKYEIKKQTAKSFVDLVNKWLNPPIEYQIIQQRGPKTITLHREKLSIFFQFGYK